MEIHTVGLAGLLGFYGLILGVGVLTAAAKRKKPGDRNNMILANQQLGLFLGVSSLVGKYLVRSAKRAHFRSAFFDLSTFFIIFLFFLNS